MSDIRLLENIKDINSRIAQSAIRSGRNPEEIKLVAVTKNVDIDKVRRAVEAGLTDLGENRVQEARKKVMSEDLKVMREKITWHLIGHLQKNKAKTAVNLFDVIQSVDSIELAELINKHAEKRGKTQRVMLQVKLSDEVSKHGIIKKNIMKFLDAASNMGNLKIEGFMTMPPYFDDPESARPYFRELSGIGKEAEYMGYGVHELSMGMSNDFEVAIEEGATIVRVGTAIFGERSG